MHDSVLDYIEGVSDGTSPYRLYFPTYRAGGVFNLQMVSAWDEDNAVTRILVGVEREGKTVWLLSFESVSAGQVVSFDNHIYFPSDYRVVIAFVGSTSGDKLHAAIGGLVKYGTK